MRCFSENVRLDHLSGVDLPQWPLAHLARDMHSAPTKVWTAEGEHDRLLALATRNAPFSQLDGVFRKFEAGLIRAYKPTLAQRISYREHARTKFERR